MNDTPDKDREENDRLLRLLEAATAPRDGREASQHAEGDEHADLRATWLAFGRLLDAATEAQPSEARSASEQIETRSASEENKPQPRVYAERSSLSESINAHNASYQRKVRRIRRFTAIVAVAAAACGILLAAGGLSLNWWLDRAARQINQGLPVVGPERQPNVQPQQEAPKAPTPAVVHNDIQVAQHKATAPKQNISAAKNSTWDDAIDEEITSVSQQIESVRQTWRHGVDDVDLVQYRVDEVSAGLTKDAL